MLQLKEQKNPLETHKCVHIYTNTLIKLEEGTLTAGANKEAEGFRFLAVWIWIDFHLMFKVNFTFIQ